MAAPDLNENLRVPGNLYLDPTAVESSAPFGGTQLGRVEQISFRLTRARVPLAWECFGEQTVEHVDVGEVAVLAAALYSWDSDTLRVLFEEHTATTSSRGNRVLDGDARRVGRPRSDNVRSILFAPDDLSRHRLVLLPRAIPWTGEETWDLKLSLADDALFAAVFVALPQANGTVPYRIFRWRDLAGDGAGAVV